MTKVKEPTRSSDQKKQELLLRELQQVRDSFVIVSNQVSQQLTAVLSKTA